MLSSASLILLTITLELTTILQNISSRVVGSVLMNISPSNIFQTMLSPERFNQSCQVAVSVNMLNQAFCEARFTLTLMLLVAKLANTKWCKKRKNVWNPDTWVLIWEYSVGTIQWVPTWQGLDDFRKPMCSWPLVESSLSIGRVDAKERKMSETLTHGYSSESTQWELSNEYQHDRV